MLGIGEGQGPGAVEIVGEGLLGKLNGQRSVLGGDVGEA